MQAFVALCGERGVGALSVAAIARRAGINRATFYRHFEDKADLLERGLDDILSEIGDRVERGYDPAGDSLERAVARIEVLFRIFDERRSLFLTLVSGAMGPTFSRRVESFVETYIWERRILPMVGSEAALSIPRDILSRFISSLLLGLAAWWLEHPGVADARTMAGHYVRLVAYGAGAARKG